MTALTLPDLAAFAWFLGAWIVYSIVIERESMANLGALFAGNDACLRGEHQPVGLSAAVRSASMRVQGDKQCRRQSRPDTRPCVRLPSAK
jgi:hypothetical protein